LKRKELPIPNTNLTIVKFDVLYYVKGFEEEEEKEKGIQEEGISKDENKQEMIQETNIRSDRIRIVAGEQEDVFGTSSSSTATTNTLPSSSSTSTSIWRNRSQEIEIDSHTGMGKWQVITTRVVDEIKEEAAYEEIREELYKATTTASDIKQSIDDDNQQVDMSLTYIYYWILSYI
jgi:hypothetical protein